MKFVVNILSKVTDLFDTNPQLCFGWIFLILGIGGVFMQDLEARTLGIFFVITGMTFIISANNKK